MEELQYNSINSEQINSINYMRLICAFLVVSIHTKPFLDINVNLSNIICEVIAKIAVPFFFATSGYFYFKSIKINYSKSIKYLCRLILLYLSWSIIYDIRQLFRVIYSHGSIISATKGFIVEFFINGSFFHMWYMVALIYSVIIAHIFIKYDKLKYLYVISIILFVIGILIGPYSKLIPDYFHSHIINNMQFRRIFTIGMPFFMLGYIINNYNIKKFSILLSICFGLLFIIEIKIITNLSIQTDVLTTIFMYPLVLFILMACINHKSTRYEKYSIESKKLSSFIYFVHPIFISILKKFLSSETLLFLGTNILSIVLGMILIKINNKKLNKLLF